MKSGISTITSKGQLTLPVNIREALSLQSGDRVEFVLDDCGTVRVRALNKSPDAFLNSLEPRNPDPAYTSDDDAIMAEVEDKDQRSSALNSAPITRGRAA